jgi:hypothetical protein
MAETQRGGIDWLVPIVVLGGGALVLWGLGVFGKGEEGAPGVFNIGQPIVQPDRVALGDIVHITCPIAMSEGKEFTGQVVIKVQEGSIFATPGDLLYQKFFSNVKFTPGSTQNFEFDWVASGAEEYYGPLTRATGDKDIEVFINWGSQGVDSHHFDDVIKVVPVSLGFYCLQPVVTPDYAPLGTTVQIQCPIVSECNGKVKARVRMQVCESSIWAPPGDLLEEKISAYQDMAPGETVEFSFTHITRGAKGSKDVNVYIEVNDKEAPGGNNFDDAFHVT